MTVRQAAKDKQMRYRIAMEAARIIAEGGVRDFHVAKRKAASKLGAPNTRNMPRNAEIEEALIEHQRLFKSDSHSNTIKQLLDSALEAMEFFSDFRPRLTGPILNGTANAHSSVELHLFATTPEDVAVFLMDHHIPYQQIEKRLRLGQEKYESYPGFRFLAGETDVELIVFTENKSRQAPLDQVSGKPMQRASIEEVEVLLQKESEDLN
ncbi:MAG: hypothetical protein OEW89_07125 [Gammaproteobacteria bacterium]|nr:hypothetical protein [Gammaproteobacteria bacterium]MDH5593646.1 hypothetical protein [Gammaproteobacteria bacterium]MDH5613984.1 hypothetical protein [Gammaproteobacteria bacterium]